MKYSTHEQSVLRRQPKRVLASKLKVIYPPEDCAGLTQEIWLQGLTGTDSARFRAAHRRELGLNSHVSKQGLEVGNSKTNTRISYLLATAITSILFNSTVFGQDIDHVKQELVKQLITSSGMDVHDLQSVDLQIAPTKTSDGIAAYTAAGQIKLGWLQPRTANEAATIYAHQNVCNAVGKECEPGIHHTIYLDITAIPSSGSMPFKITGDTAVDQTLAAVRQQRPRRMDQYGLPLPANAPGCKPVLTWKHKEEPRYPPGALKQHHAGQVLVRVYLTSDGFPIDVNVVKSSGFRELDRAAYEAAKLDRYQPVICEGTQTPAEAAITFTNTFSLSGPSHGP